MFSFNFKNKELGTRDPQTEKLVQADQEIAVRGSLLGTAKGSPIFFGLTSFELADRIRPRSIGL